MIINRIRARPNKWTFTIKPIAELLKRYNVGKNWIDPYAGKNSPAEFTNDLDSDMPALYHLDSLDFINVLWQKNPEQIFDGVLLDPPYSYRQISEHYKKSKVPFTYLDTTSQFYNRIMNAICDYIKIGGFAISFGWNSNGFGKNRGFEIIEILLIAHGSHHNDTIVVVEQKKEEFFIVD